MARPHRSTTSRTVLTLVGLAVTLTACSGGADPAPSATTTAEQPAVPSDTAATATPQPDAPALLDAWVKAADSGMTGVFGTLTNPTGSDVRVVGGHTEAAGMLELHETADDGTGSMVMRPKEGGFLVPAGGEHVLAPGGDHIMLMQLTGPVLPGDEVTVVLETDAGTELTVTAVARSFSGADEDYPSDGMSSMPDGSGSGHGMAGDS